MKIEKDAMETVTYWVFVEGKSRDEREWCAAGNRWSARIL